MFFIGLSLMQVKRNFFGRWEYDFKQINRLWPGVSMTRFDQKNPLDKLQMQQGKAYWNLIRK